MPFRVVSRNSSTSRRPRTFVLLSAWTARTFVLIRLLATSTRTFVLLSLFYKKIRKILKVHHFKNRCSIRVVIESRWPWSSAFRVVNLKVFRILEKTLDKRPKIGYNGISSDERRATQQNKSGGAPKAKAGMIARAHPRQKRPKMDSAQTSPTARLER